MKKACEETIGEWTGLLSEKTPVPGGGGASALAGVLAAALGGMVSNLTIGRKKYAAVSADVERILAELEKTRKDLLAEIDEDARVFAPLAAAYGIRAQTEEEKAEKDRIMEECLLAASMAPLHVMELSCGLFESLAFLEKYGNRMAVSDVGVAAELARAAVYGAAMNVYINVKSMKDRQKADEILSRARLLLAKAAEESKDIYNAVEAELTGDM